MTRFQRQTSLLIFFQTNKQTTKQPNNQPTKQTNNQPTNQTKKTHNINNNSLLRVFFPFPIHSSISCPENGCPNQALLGYNGSGLGFGRLLSYQTKEVSNTQLHPGRLPWNLQITHLERKIIFQTSMIMLHVNLQGCIKGLFHKPLYGCKSKNSCFFLRPQIIHFNRVFHYFHHPFWGTSIFGNTHMEVSIGSHYKTLVGCLI